MKPQSLFLQSLAVVLALLLVMPLAAQEEARVKPTAPTLTNLPGDIISGVFVRDLSLLRTKWSESRFHEAWQSPEMEDGRTLAAESFADIMGELRETSGVDIGPLFGKLDGFAALFITHLELFPSEGDFTVLDLCFVAEVAEEKHEDLEEAIREMLSNVAPEDARRSSERFRDVQIYTTRWHPELVMGQPASELSPDIRRATEIRVSYAFLEDALIVTEGPNEPAKKIIDAILNEEANRLGGNNSFRYLEGRLRDSGDALVYVDLPQFFEQLAEAGRENPDYQTIVAGLEGAGVSSLGALMFSGKIMPRELITEVVLRVPREKTGILRTIYAGGTTRLQTARVAPPNADRYSSFVLDGTEVWRTLREIVEGIDPSTMMFLDAMIGGQEAQLGVSIERDLIGNIAGEHGYWTTPGLDPDAPADDPGGLTVALGLRSSEEGHRAVNGLFSALAAPPFEQPFESSQQDGFTIWQYEDPGMAAANPFGAFFEPPVVALAPRHIMIVPSMRAARDNLRRAAEIDNPESGLAGTEAFRRGVARVPAENLAYFDFSLPNVIGETVQVMIEGPDMTEINQMMREMGFEVEDEEPEHRAPSRDWWERWFGPSVTGTNLDTQTIHLWSLMQAAEN